MMNTKRFESLDLAKIFLLEEINRMSPSHRNGVLVKEIIGISFTIPLFSDIKVDDTQLKYANKKILDYKQDIERIERLIREERTTRQASIVFNQNQQNPNCILANSFTISRGILDSFVFSRSLDVNSKLECDVLIAQKIAEYISLQTKINKESSQLHFVCVNAHIYL